MGRRTLSPEVMAAWGAYLRGWGELRRELNARLVARHGLTLSDYEALLRLGQAPGRRLKRSELAQGVVLTPSGTTRLLAGLEKAGYVEKGTSPTDARVSYAVLTEAGLAKLRAAAETHVADVEELFASRFDEAELAQLASLLGRVGNAGRARDAA